ncbi:MAG: tRNA lysidine(34) synthetase TilS [Cytophagaceae bacterium]
MFDRFIRYITQKIQIRLHESVILAVSGGVDSVVLADMMQKTDIKFCIAHCNFRLRGEESEEDEKFVRELATSLNVPIFVKYFNTEDYASEKKISTQMAARELRYKWFEELRQELEYDYVAVAHHLNDSVETILLNLTKGTGIAGLHGIGSKVGKIVRPLLFAEKDEVLAYAIQNSLKWRDDSSNESLKYQRNLIRNEVVPLLKKINPNLEQTMRLTMEKISAVEGLYNEKLEQVRQQVFTKEGSLIKLNLSNLLDEKEPVILIAGLLEPFGFSYTDAKSIAEASGESGKQFFSSTHRAVTGRNELIISEIPGSKEKAIRLDENTRNFSFAGKQFSWNVLEKADAVISGDPDTAFLDYDLLKFPLELRYWQQGDRFVPLGMKGYKKVSDLLVDRKLSIPEKEQVVVLCSGGEIVWVVGLRLDDRFKVTDQTKKTLLISKL